MALFKVVTVASDLPHPGTGRESGTFDFKGEVDPTDPRELAKDVAGLANALGGVILVGAYEDKQTGLLGCYKPIGLEASEALKRAYELALTQRCVPPPTIDPVRIEVAGGNIVAVNVYASVSAPIGVRWDVDKAGPSFAFPLRTATQTHFMVPTELAMLMVPERRRIALLLDSIPLHQRRDVLLIAPAIAGGAPGEALPTRFVGLDAALTTAIFEMPEGGGTLKIRIPLDAVRLVWMVDDDHWSVSVVGGLKRSKERYWYYQPM